MYIIGQLSDRTMHDQILAQMQERGLSVSSTFDEQSHVFTLLVEKEEEIEAAADIFRVKMGFQKPYEVDSEWIKIKSLPRGEVTYLFIIVCVGLYILSFTEMGRRFYDVLFMGRVETGFLAEIKQGQVWRLLTPIFLHLSLMHILFNMLWFRDLGYIIEHKFGRQDLLAFIVITGVLSNLMQYLVSGPQFGGMSGVLYAMLGYIWVYKKIDDQFDFPLPKRDVGLMIGWLFLCLTGLLGPIANTAHAGGLFSGMLYALYRGHSSGFSWGKTQLKYFFLAVLFLAFTIGVEGIKLGGRFFYLLWG